MLTLPSYALYLLCRRNVNEEHGTDRSGRNLFIHDVTGVHDYFNNGGIVFRVTGNDVPTNFDDVMIENNEIRNISGFRLCLGTPALGAGTTGSNIGAYGGDGVACE